MQCRVREEVRRQETGEKKVQCFRCWRIKHYKQQCSNIKVEKERKGGQEVACVVNPQKAQQVKKLVHFLWRKVQKYSSVQDMPLRSVALEERGWKTRQEVVTFVEYSGCNYKGTKTEENQGQDFVSREKLRNVWYENCLEVLKWRNKEAGSRVKCTKCGRKDMIVKEEILEEGRRNIQYPEYRTGRKQLWQNWGVVAYPEQGKVQQSSTWTEAPKSAVRERGKQREVKRTFKMLREVWLNIGVEKMNTHEDIIVKVLLDSSTIGIFMDQKMAVRHRFRLQKLERPIVVRNIDRTNNSAEAITYQVEVNVYYKSYVKRMRMDVCNLGKTDIILGMLWLQVHNPEINWETGEVKMTRCPPLCGRSTKLKEKKKEKKEKRIATLEEEKIIR